MNSVGKEKVFLYPLKFNTGGLQIKLMRQISKRKELYVHVQCSYTQKASKMSNLKRWLEFGAYIPNLVGKKEKRKGFYGKYK